MARTTKRRPGGTRNAAGAVGVRRRDKPKRSGARSSSAKRSSADLPIVVIGASAGGLDALKRFLTAMPASSGMAFVLVPHLDPTHESLMVELLARHTSMPVCEAAHGAVLRRNTVYVIPPNKFLAVKRRALVLSKAPEPRGLQTAIDFALCSLAKDRKAAAIGVVLSGTGSHGTLGAKEIKLAGGTVIAQDPATAEYDQMPRSVLATGLVDFKLAPEDMPRALMRIARQARPILSRSRNGDEPAVAVLQPVLSLLQARGGHDFRHYRANMVMRRIKRRMTLLQIDGWKGYLERLRHDADEVTAVCKDLLIGVTSFFRDPGAFDALARQVAPILVERSRVATPLRIWVPGCATGEEAYSIAMLLTEAFEAVDRAPNFHIFATDVDDDSLETARRGIYPEAIASALSPERLQKFFLRTDEHRYQIGKRLRDSIGFTVQNLITDAPFSKLDLVSCRNLLIYLDPEIQDKVISLLHFALTDDGYLMLGSAESVGKTPDMFEPIAKKWRVYHRTGTASSGRPTIPIVTAEEHRQGLMRNPPLERSRGSFPDLMRKLLVANFAPASVLINAKYQILSAHGPLVNYLEFPSGELTKDLLVMARQGLRTKIRTACDRAARDLRPVDADARVSRDGGYVPCSIAVRPVKESKEAEGLVLVSFRDREEAAPAQSGEAPTAAQLAVVGELENELRTTREDLQSTIEQLQSSNEELRASNEEVMSMNEELQSANEELETSKEELQSLNEELATVNHQLHEKVDELADANSDLLNVMAATDIATVFLDTELRIKRFTPPVGALLSVIATDIGRPFRDLALKFDDADLLRDAQRVIETFSPAEKEVRADTNRWYLRRILPYQSTAHRVGGVVVTFIDITQRVSAEALARRLATVLLDSNDAVSVCDFNGRISAWNLGAERMYGYGEAEALKMNFRDLVPDQQKASALDLVQRAIRGEPHAPCSARRVTREGQALDVWVTATPLRDETGEAVAIAVTERKITAHWEVEEEIRNLNAVLEQRIANRTADLEASEERIRSVLDAAVDSIVTIDAMGTIQTFNAGAERAFGYAAQEVIGRNVKLLIPSPFTEQHDAHLTRYRETRERRIIGVTRELTARRKDGTEFPIQLSVNEIAQLGLFTGIIRDITEQKALHEEIVRIAMLEQRRIGQELHDGTQQELTGLSLLAKSLSEALAAQGTSRESELAAKLAAGIAETNWHVHSLARGLVPVPIDARGLMAALDDLARSVAERNGPRCRFECPTPVELKNDIIATHLYRIAQEAVTNAVKHSRADTILIRLQHRAGQVELSVSDNGVGLERRNPQGLGMRTMEHRGALIGGALTISRQKRGGTVVTCTVPMRSVSESRPIESASGEPR